MARAPEPGVRWVRGNLELARACDRWQRCAAVALDTEFERVATYRPRPALLQFTDGADNWLVDPLEIDDWTPLRSLLASTDTCKVMHACAEDCELLYQLSGVVPGALYDTQIAASFAGLGMQLGYESLVEALCDIRPRGGQARSDWLARPLTEAQLHYAIEDVRWLLPLRERLEPMLAQRGHGRWAAAECARVVAERAAEPAPQLAYLKVGDAWRLDPPALAALAALAAWREREAQRRDRPRRHVLADETLVALATARPRDRDALLAAAGGRSARWPRERVVALLGAIEGAAGAPPPAPPRAPSTTRAATATIRRLKRAVREQAAALGLPAALLAPGRLLEAIVAAAAGDRNAVANQLDGWRDEAVGECLRACLAATREDSD